MVIMFNVWESSHAAEYELEVGHENAQTRFTRNSELFLFCFYVGELLVKLWVLHGLYFLCNADWKFNWFDLLLVGHLHVHVHVSSCPHPIRIPSAYSLQVQRTSSPRAVIIT